MRAREWRSTLRAVPDTKALGRKMVPETEPRLGVVNSALRTGSGSFLLEVWRSFCITLQINQVQKLRGRSRVAEGAMRLGILKPPVRVATPKKYDPS
jgi:hypothetical protein